MTQDTADKDAMHEMMDILVRAGRNHFRKENAWESCLCALVMALQPRSKSYRMLEALPHHHRPLDQADTLNAIANLGYFGRSSKLRISAIDPRLLPCLFVLDSGEPVTLLEDKGKTLKFCRQGRIQEAPKENLPQKTGTAWIFEPFDENRPSTSKFMRTGSGYSWFRALLGRFKGTCGQVFLAGLMLNLLALTTPIFILLVYDRVIASGSLATLPMLLAGAAIAIGFEWHLRKVRSRALSWIASRMDNVVSNRIFAHLIGLSPDMVENASVAAQIARIKTFESVRDFFSGSVFLSALEMPFVILAVLAIFAISGPLALVPLSMLAAYASLFWIVQRKIKVSIRLAAKASSARQQFAIETFEKIRGIRAYGLTARWAEKFRDLSGREMLAHFQLNWLGMVAETFAHALTVFSAVATVGFGVHMIWSGTITTGALVASMILVWRVLMPFYGVCTMIPRLEQLRNSIIQINKLMEIDTEAMESRNVSRLSSLRGRVGFNNVTLRYDDKGDQVFTGLTFEVRPGDLVTVTGENGSGKTSLLKMIKGMHAAENGSVSIDGFDIRQLDAPDLRRQIAYVPQQHNIFDGSIIENLRMANPLASEDDVKNALQAADAWQEIVAMPDGVHTKIGKYSGETLSASLLIRLSLARMYLYPAPIILIDEIPNSVLSGRVGQSLKEYLASIKGKHTVFMVTYREDFMQMSDLVINLRRGKTAHVGNREAMIQTLLEEAA